MNRRVAIFRMMMCSVGIGVVSYGGFTFYKNTREISLSVLPEYMTMLAELVDIIIPVTNTPSAKDAQVHLFIALMIKDCLSNKEQRNFLNGLVDLQQYCLNHYGKAFEECSNPQKNELLNQLEQEESKGIILKVRTKILGSSFFNTLKRLTIEGYCTSKLGATNHLAYQHIPGDYYLINTSLKKQKSWATK